MTHYIFGYGSLICSKSRQLTVATGTTTPCRANGYIRSWSWLPHHSFAPVAVAQNESTSVNGILFEIQDEKLDKFDARERGYLRSPLAHDSVELLSQFPRNDSDRYWIYLRESFQPPDFSCPITQSYLNVVLYGCLEISDDFAREFVQTTLGWNAPWIDDAHDPIYPRHHAAALHKQEIRNFLEKVLPHEYSQRSQG